MSDYEEWVPGNKSELMSAIAREWNLLMDVVSKLDETRMTAGVRKTTLPISPSG
jgi:hypothetical protein